MDKKGALAITQIILLLISIVAFSIIFSGGFVGAKDAMKEEDLSERKFHEDPDLSKLDVGAGKGKGAAIIPVAGSSQLSKWAQIGDTPKDGTAEFFSWKAGGAADAIFTGAQWGLMAYGFTKMFGSMLGMEDAKLDAISSAAGWGFFTGKSLSVLFGEGGVWYGKTPFGWTAGQFSFAAGALVAAYMFYKTYRKENTETITFTCEPWDAPTGGKYCEECNKQGLPCSEYQCRSLGQACELLNPGTDEEKCVWVNRNDIKPPVIEPWEDALLYDYVYKPNNVVSPPDKGAIVWNKATTGCAEAFTPLTFGITLNEPAKCKIDSSRKDNFDEMDYYFGGSSLLKYNHTQVMSLPGPGALEAENLTIQNDGEFEAYVRCQDANGNTNTANFVFKYCVEKGPDTTPPLIVTTNLLNNMPIAYNQTSVDLEVYVNEPAECRWSHLKQSYNDMPNEMSCSLSVMEMNAQMLYKCSTTLTGLKNKVENNFYFKCKDQPTKPNEDRNVNTEPYEFTLIGTQPLIIDSVGPNETIKDSTDTVKVTLEAKTSAGYKEGEAICYYENLETGEGDQFYNTNSHEHSQELWLAEGDYEYSIKCVDLGGNSDTRTINFKVETDIDEPIVVRAYHEDSYLKLITNEPAECVYDTTDCSYPFDDGIKMSVIDDINHFTDWDTEKDFYIKCQDDFGNRPTPQNICSIVVRPFEVYKQEE